MQQGTARGERESSLSSSLLVRVKSHDADAWQRLVAIYSPLVYRWCRRAELQPDDALDVVQDVFRSVVVAIERFRRDRAGDSFRGWLRTITRNQISDHFRLAGGRPRAIGGSDAQSRFAEVACESPPEEEAAEMSGVVGRALELVRTDFEEKTWTAFWRTTVAGQSPAEVAEAIEMTVGAVYKAKSRVLARLRAELEGLVDA
jgi:RNA polymerase sigma-70 factor (ECF subfamily)